MTNMHTPPIDPPSTPSNRASRRGVAIGLSAGLVGGSLAGLMLGVPGLSSAADDGDVAPVAVVRQVDDPTDAPGDDVEPTEAAPVEQGERLREMLQALVDDATLTAEQADAVTTHLVENRPERHQHGDRGDRGGRRGPGRFDRSNVVTELLGIDAQTLRDELRAGSTLAEIAEANGVDTDTLIAALVDQAEVRIDAAVEAERLTAEEAAEKLAELETRITDKINGD